MGGGDGGADSGGQDGGESSPSPTPEVNSDDSSSDTDLNDRSSGVVAQDRVGVSGQGFANLSFDDTLGGSNQALGDAVAQLMLIHVHGGCYELSPGEAGTSEAIMMVGLGHFKVISVDYRMPPEAYFPGALDDAMTVYQAMLKATNPRNVAVFGSSAGCARDE